MPSTPYEALVARVEELKARFVNFDIPIDRDPNSHELDMIASFKLLVHAEIEEFIETRIFETIEESVTIWETQRRVTRGLLNLAVRWYPWFEQEKNPNARPQSFQAFSAFLKDTAARARSEVNENNGIRQNSFSRLCYSVGIMLDDLPGALLASLDSYGRGRGEVAHQTVGKVRTLNDPRVEGQDAEQLVQLLLSFDNDLSAAAMP
jgi:hypothetical protein